MSNQSSVERLVEQALQGPLYTAMQLLIQDVYRGYNQLFPSPIVSGQSLVGGALNPQSQVSNFQVTIQPTNIHLSWNATLNAVAYEIRYSLASNDWDSATFINQNHSLQADISPYAIPFLYGTYHFLIKAIDSVGTYSNVANEFVITIPQIQKPTVTATVIGNNVLLQWSTPVSVFQIDHYNIYSNGTLVGTVRATFDVIFEQVGGNYAFTVEAVDIVGNVSLPSTDVIVTLGNPTDFSFFSSLTSTLNGTLVNTVIDIDGTLFAPDTSDDYEHHFTDNSFTSWQDAIDAGYALYFEPSDVLVGTYEEIFDFGTIINAVLVGIDYNVTRQIGSVNITATIAVSTDNITYDSPVAGTSRYATSIRYAKVKVTLTAADNKSSINLFNLRCLLSVRKENDGGSVNVANTGTHITYNKTFIAIDTVTLTVQQNNAYFAIYAFDTPATAGFTIFVYNGAGVAQNNVNVAWSARGVTS